MDQMRVQPGKKTGMDICQTRWHAFNDKSTHRIVRDANMLNKNPMLLMSNYTRAIFVVSLDWGR